MSLLRPGRDGPTLALAVGSRRWWARRTPRASSNPSQDRGRIPADLEDLHHVERKVCDSPATAAHNPDLENPALLRFEHLAGQGRRFDAVRADFVRQFGFAVPTTEAIRTLRDHCENGAVEIGAGLGYWAFVARQVGIDVVAYDIEPPPSSRNLWFAGVDPWHPIRPGGESIVAEHAQRTLILVWPTRDEVWPSEALAIYRRAGGRRVIYVGEPPGGRTGDDVFHARLGQLHGCARCRLGAPLSPCICHVHAEWRLVVTVPLPHWPGHTDNLQIFELQTRSPRDVRAPDAARSAFVLNGRMASVTTPRRRSWRRVRARS